MPARNEPCPCGGGAKYKRCCLVKLDAVARELRQRDEVLGAAVEWITAEHEQTVAEAEAETTLLRLLRGSAGRTASRVWAVTDYPPADGGLPLMARFAARPELAASVCEVARGLADARLGVYQVRSVVAPLWVELESLYDGAPARLAARDGLGQLRVGDILVARIVTTTTIPTTWGSCFRSDRQSRRRWEALLAALPEDRAEAALAVLRFHPDDVAEPLPDGLEVCVATWEIEDQDDALDAIEEDDAWEGIGQEMPVGSWAFAWLDEAPVSGCDLGGWQEDDGAVEVARLVVLEREIRLVSADPERLAAVAERVEESLGRLIVPRSSHARHAA